jgi:hypothetical protein
VKEVIGASDAPSSVVEVYRYRETLNRFKVEGNFNCRRSRVDNSLEEDSFDRACIVLSNAGMKAGRRYVYSTSVTLVMFVYI